jgi:hypothetical protein
VAGDTISAVLKRVDFESMPLFSHRWYPENWRVKFALWMRAHGVVYPN